MTDDTIRHDPTESDKVLEVLARVSSYSFKEIYVPSHTLSVHLPLVLSILT